VAARVSLVVVARDGFSTAPACLEHLLESTREPFELVYVDGNAPRPVQRRIRQCVRDHGGTLIRADRYLKPTSARNLGLREIHTPLVVFLDNGVRVGAGWLSALVDCAERTGAAFVSPVVSLARRSGPVVHVAGGTNRIEVGAGGRRLVESYGHAERPLHEALATLRPQPTSMAEFHAVLVRTGLLQRLGGLDEGCSTAFEHNDLCLSLAELGGTGWLEPRAVVEFLEDSGDTDADALYAMLRWCRSWIDESLRAFCAKWGLSTDDPALRRDLEVLHQRRRVPIRALRGRATRLAGEAGGRALDRGADWLVDAVLRPWHERAPALEWTRFGPRGARSRSIPARAGTGAAPRDSGAEHQRSDALQRAAVGEPGKADPATAAVARVRVEEQDRERAARVAAPVRGRAVPHALVMEVDPAGAHWPLDHAHPLARVELGQAPPQSPVVARQIRRIAPGVRAWNQRQTAAGRRRIVERDPGGQRRVGRDQGKRGHVAVPAVPASTARRLVEQLVEQHAKPAAPGDLRCGGDEPRMAHQLQERETGAVQVVELEELASRAVVEPFAGHRARRPARALEDPLEFRAQPCKLDRAGEPGPGGEAQALVAAPPRLGAAERLGEVDGAHPSHRPPGRPSDPGQLRLHHAPRALRRSPIASPASRVARIRVTRILHSIHELASVFVARIGSPMRCASSPRNLGIES
jgi:GT2 family glycosyltransferase